MKIRLLGRHRNRLVWSVSSTVEFTDRPGWPGRHTGTASNVGFGLLRVLRQHRKDIKRYREGRTP